MAIASIANLQFNSTTDAAFQSWGSQISAALQSCGLVQTGNTGQIDWSTVTATTGSTPGEIMRGYEIYKFNDSLQATAPVYIKIEYGFVVMYQNTYGATTPAMYVTVGTGTNGAGTLSGVLSTRTRLLGASAYGDGGSTGSWVFSSINTPCYFSGDGSYINVGLGISGGNIGGAQWYNSWGPTYFYSSFPAMLSIDRSRNSDGSINNHGLVILISKWTTANSGVAPTVPVPTCQYLSFTGQGAATAFSYWPIIWPGIAFGNGINGSNLDFWPLAVATPQAEAQGLAVLGCYKTDLNVSSTVTVNVLGSNHTYISFAGIGGTVANDNTRSYVNPRVPGGAILMRYE